MNKLAKTPIVLLSASMLAGCSMASLPVSLSETHRNIKQMREDGVEIDLVMSNFEMENSDDTVSGNIHFGQKGDVMWAIFDGEEDGEAVKEGVAIAKDEDGAYLQYKLNFDTMEYDFDVKVTDTDVIKEIDYMVEFALTYAHSVSALLSNAGTEEYLGRECSVYNFAFNNVLNVFGAEADVKIYVDNTTGVTLKAEHNIYAGGEETGFTFEITKFVTEGVTLPVLNDLVVLA